MANYALVGTDNLVKSVIIADAAFITANGDALKAQYGDASGTWQVLSLDKAGKDWKYGSSLFVNNLIASLALTAPDPFHLGVQVDGSGTITYQWKKDTVNISGETAATLTIDPTTASTDDGDYTCEVSDGTNTLTTNGCTLTVT